MPRLTMTALRVLGLSILFGAPLVMIYAAGMRDGSLFFGAWLGGSLVGGLIGAYIDAACRGVGLRCNTRVI